MEGVGGTPPRPRALCHTGASAGGTGIKTAAAQTCSVPGGGCRLNDEAMVSPRHSLFFMTAELQKQKLFTLRLKLSVTCAEEMPSTAFCLGLTWGNMPGSLSQSPFRCHFCLSVTLLHESYSQDSVSEVPELSPSLGPQNHCGTLTPPRGMLLPHQGQVWGLGQVSHFST